jgi:leader peptidase (prepilin peptidase)/N-methyltransferase
VLVYPAGMGGGDVKLAGVLGMVLAWYGWAELVVGGFLGFLLGGVIGVLLILTGRGTRKTMIPFGPYMIVGAWLAIGVARPVTSWYLGLTGLQ